MRKVTVVTSTSHHSTRRPHRDHCHPGQSYNAHNTLLVGQYGVKIVILVLSSSGSLSEHQPVHSGPLRTGSMAFEAIMQQILD